jgi:N-acetylglucosamine-6-phosphate deacetylase
MRYVARSCESGQWIALTLSGSHIESVEPVDAPAVSHSGSGPDSTDLWVAPGFIDLQVNGYGGFNFNLGLEQPEVTDETVGQVVELLAKSGTTQFCPTVVTASYEATCTSLSAIAHACGTDADLAEAMPAIHLEGPYMSGEEGARGAHPPAYLRDPDWDEFQRFQAAAAGLIKIVTLAPEREGAVAFIEKAVAAGIVVSLGHTTANTLQIEAAVEAGAALSTHLGNGSQAMMPRHPNPIWDQLANDGLVTCFIADGFHLPATALRAMVRAAGIERTILVSDVVALGGLPAGLYDNGRHEVLPSGKVVLAGTPYLAGAGFLLDHCIA